MSTALALDLEAAIVGEVRFDAGSRALYANDASNYRQPPIGVVVPKTIDDIIAAHRVCRAHGAPVLSRGAGTSLSGESVNHAVILDHSKYLRDVVEIDPVEQRVTVQTGAVNDHVNEAVGQHGLVFPPDPSTHGWCTIGGNVGNNSCGMHSVQAQFFGHGPRTSDNVHALDILTYDGERMTLKDGYSEQEIDGIIRAGGRRGEIFSGLRSLRDRYAELIRDRFPNVARLPRRVSGYNLDDLLPERGFNLASALCGTEGTCVTVLHATLKLTRNPRHRTLLAIGFEDIYVAADHVPAIMAQRPIALEGIDHALFRNERDQDMHPRALSHLPDGNAWLLVEFGGDDREEAKGKADSLMQRLERELQAPTGYRTIDDEVEKRRLWQVREGGLGATAAPPGGSRHWPGWEDSAVPPERVGEYLRDLTALYDRHGLQGALYGHFGQGCVHSRIDFDLKTRPGVEGFRAFMEEAAELVVSYGGSLSGEHGDGQARAELLERMYGAELVQAFREFKSIWDPEWKMNPGKVVDPHRLDEDLRLGPGYDPPDPPTTFRFPDDRRSFARVSLRCVGVGKCRRDEGGTMCPSYRVTREEQHLTRGRARMLFEMLQGDVIGGGWQDEAVKDSLSLCLSCKACKSECPVNVDIATYKAEFLSHYYEGRRRPLSAYAFGLIDRWSRLASRMPAAVNFAMRAPGLSDAGRAALNIPRERRLPPYAPRSFRRWFARRPVRNDGAPAVMLWVDTFSNHFFPDTAQAAVEVLEAAGFRVLTPPPGLCCGRPLYEFGMLDEARRYLSRIMERLGSALANGIPIIGLEPSCLSVFRDELTNLFPDDERARRLSRQSVLLSEFLVAQADKGYRVPRLRRKALVHGHCHHKAILGMDAEKKLMDVMGLDYEVLDSGCCGMAGSFGFERDKFEVSMKAGERVLLPRVREAADDTLIIANGFSCREQIAQATDRRALHIAEVLKMALAGGTEVRPGEVPGAAIGRRRTRARRRANRRAVASIGAITVGGLLIRSLLQRQ